MTLEQKAKAYDEAIERAKEELGSGCFNKGSIEYIFPELKEDNDERIRKWLLNFVQGIPDKGLDFSHYNIEKADVLAWLEKLKDFDKQLDEAYQTANAVVYKKGYDDGYLEGIVNAKKEFEKSKHIVIDIDKMVSKYANTKESSTSNLPLNCQIRAYRQGINNALNLLLDIEKPITIGKRQLTGKAKELYDNLDAESLAETKKKMLAETAPKFKVGDWVTDGVAKCQIYSIDDNQYWYSENCILGSIESVNKQYHLWSIQDAKDGDVLAFNDDAIVLFKEVCNDDEFCCYCYCTTGDYGFYSSSSCCWEQKGFSPATEEQRKLLFKKMGESGYKWDAYKKELTRSQLIKKSEHDGKKWIDEKVYWKEREELFEDGKQEVINNPIKYGLIKYEDHTANAGKKVEPNVWTDEDEKMLNDAIGAVWAADYYTYDDKQEIENWIKSIKEKLQ